MAAFFTKNSGLTDSCCNGIGTAFAVDGCADDAAGIACALAAGIEATQADMMEVLFVAHYAHGRRGARLDCYHRGVVGEKTVMVFTKKQETLAQPVGEKTRQPEVKGRSDKACSVGSGG